MNEQEMRMWCLDRVLPMMGNDPSAATAFAEELFEYIGGGKLSEAAKQKKQSRK